MKIGIYGGTNNKSYSVKEQAECEKLGKYLGSLGMEVITGACGGFPYFTGKAVIAAGGKVTGFSPAVDEKEQCIKYNFPMDGCTNIVYQQKGITSPAESLVLRMSNMVPNADIVVAMGGSWGTFYELLLSFYYRKTIILVEEFQGAVKAFNDAYKYFGKHDVNPAIHNGATIIRVKTVDQAIKELEKLLNK